MLYIGKNVRNCPRNLMEVEILGYLERVSEQLEKTSEKSAKMSKMERPEWGAGL